jgi:hypothetical protein
MAILAISLYIDAFSKSHFKSNFGVRVIVGSTQSSLPWSNPAAKRRYTAKVQFGLGDFALTSVSLTLNPLVYFMFIPEYSRADFNPLRKLVRFLQLFSSFWADFQRGPPYAFPVFRVGLCGGPSCCAMRRMRSRSF